MLGRDVKHVARALSGDRERRKIQRLRVYLAVSRQEGRLAERAGVDVGPGQRRFAQILAGAAVVVVIRRDVSPNRRGDGSRDQRGAQYQCGEEGLMAHESHERNLRATLGRGKLPRFRVFFGPLTHHA